MNKTLQILEQALTERAKWRERGVRLQRPTETVAEYIGQDFHYLSFTALKKLGLNPSTQWATPLGIYAYPLGDEWFKGAWAKSLAGANGEKGGIPFATEQPYIQLFRAKASRNVVVVGKSGNAIENDALVAKATRELMQTMPDAVERAREVIDMRGWNMQGDMRRLWLLTMFIAMEEVQGRGKMVRALKSDNQHIVRWSKMLMDLGIDGVEDRGSGIIHPNEPHQAVFFRLSDVQQIDMIANPLLKTKAAGSNDLSTPDNLSILVPKLSSTLIKFCDDMSIMDESSRTLDGRIGDEETGEIFSIEQIIKKFGDHETAYNSLERWYDQLLQIKATLFNDAFLSEGILGLGGAGGGVKRHKTKLTVVNNVRITGGETYVEGMNLLPFHANKSKVVFYFNSKSSTTLVDSYIETQTLQKINTDFEGDYKMTLRKSIVVIDPVHLPKESDVAALKTNKSETIRRVLERLFSARLGLNILLEGSFFYKEGTEQAAGDTNTVIFF